MHDRGNADNLLGVCLRILICYTEGTIRKGKIKARRSMAENALYTVRSLESGFRVVKFDKWFNVLAIYELKSTRAALHCECFQAEKSTCRHRQMVLMFLHHHRVDCGWFYCYDRETWELPIQVRRFK